MQGYAKAEILHNKLWASLGLIRNLGFRLFTLGHWKGRDEASLLSKIRIYMERINPFLDPLPIEKCKRRTFEFPALLIKGRNLLLN